MRMRTNLSIITAVGVGALLLSVLAASFTFRAQTAYAQEEEDVQTGDVHLSLLSHSVSPGKNLFGDYGFTNIPCKDKNGDGQCSYLDTFPSNFIFRVDILDGDSSVSVEDDHPCEGPGFNSTHGQGGAYTSSKTFPTLPFRITYQCPPDTYRTVLTVTYTQPDNGNEITLSDTKTFQVSVSTPTPTPTVESNNGGDQRSSQQGNNGGGNQGGSQGKYSQGRSINQGGVIVQSFISNPNPLPSYSPQQYQAPLAITIPELMNVRTGPGLTYNIVTTVPAGTQGYIYGIDPDNDWFHIELEGFENHVWVYQDLTTVIGSLAGVKWVTEAELVLLPAAITQPLLLNARAGPGLTYDILTTIPQGTWMKIVGIDTLGGWYRVDLPDLNQQAWIFRDYTKVAGGSLTGLIQLALRGNPPPGSRLTSSITVALSLPPAGGVDLEVSWVDVSGCVQLYNLYHRASPDTTVYISLDQAATSSTANSKSLSFSTLSGNSFISAWCGSMAAGREVAEVEIDPGVAGTYSSTTTSGGLAAVPDTDDGSR